MQLSTQLNYLKPSWVILGIESNEDGVRVIFARGADLQAVSIEQPQADYIGYQDVLSSWSHQNELHLTFKQMRMMKAASFEDALIQIAKEWGS